MAWVYIAALALSALSVSVLGAAFSVFGLMRLFAGAAIAVAMMASALEFSKIVAAAFLHRCWTELNLIYRTYLLLAVVVLSAITSMGIFGFLSDAYQSSSKDLAANEIKVEAIKSEQRRNSDEIARINRSIEEIPAARVTRKLKARTEAEPMIRELTQKTERLAEEIKQLDLATLDFKSKVGPLIYVARVFKADIDTVVKWLILVFVGVFDPLAICMVIATSEALKLRAEGRLSYPVSKPVPRAAEPKPQPVTQPKTQPKNQDEAREQTSAQPQKEPVYADEPVTMRYADEDDSEPKAS